MKILIVGTSGLVGWNLSRVAKAAGHEVTGTYNGFALPGLIQLSLEDREGVRALLEKEKPGAVICCSAWSWVDGCESNPEKAFRMNRDHPGFLAAEAERMGSRFVYFSTSYVFDGTRGPYREEDSPSPISIYGEAKLAGEKAVMEATAGGAIIGRTMGVYGEEPQQKNFVYQVRKNLSAGRRMKIPSDQIGNATYAPDLATMTLGLLEKGLNGIWNLAGPEPDLRRQDLARRIADAYGLDSSLFDFVSTASLGQPAPRPLHGGLAIEKISDLLRTSFPKWVKIS